MHILKDFQKQEGKPIAMAEVFIIKGITRWTLELIKKHIVSETFL